MCVYSAIGPAFQPLIPQPLTPQSPSLPPWGPVPSTGKDIDAAALRALLDAFWAAVKAAKAADAAAGQPDCVDPEKVKLEERVAELERRLDAMSAAGAKKTDVKPAQTNENLSSFSIVGPLGQLSNLVTQPK